MDSEMKNERTVYTTHGGFPFILFSSCKRKHEDMYNGSYFYFSFFFVWGLGKRTRMLSCSFSFFYFEIEKTKTKGRYISLAARAVNLAMFGNNHVIALSSRYHPINEITGGWPHATRFAFSESKMAAKMAAAYIQNMEDVITSLILEVNGWF